MARPELYALNSADWEYEYSAMMRNQKPGETYPSLTPFYVIDHPDGTVLVDTGTSYEMLEDPENYGPYGAGYIEEFAADEIEMSEDQKAVNQVTDIGYDPSEIDSVVMTHSISTTRATSASFRILSSPSSRPNSNTRGGPPTPSNESSTSRAISACSTRPSTA